VLKFDGIYGCGSIAASPDGSKLAVTCSGRTDENFDPILAESAVVLLEVGEDLKEARRIPATTLGMGAAGFSTSFADDNTLLVNTLGNLKGLEDAVVRIDLRSEDVGIILRRPAFMLSELTCATGCGACFVTDGDQGKIVRFEVGADGSVQESTAFEAETSIGLLPRALGRF
jgi:hypothetical protein